MPNRRCSAAPRLPQTGWKLLRAAAARPRELADEGRPRPEELHAIWIAEGNALRDFCAERPVHVLCDAPYGGVHPPEQFFHGATGPKNPIPFAKRRECALPECNHVGGGGLRGPPHCLCGRGRQGRGRGGAPLAPERGVAVQRSCQKGEFRRVAAATTAGCDADVAPRAVAATSRPIARELRPWWRRRRRHRLPRAAGALATELRQRAPCETCRKQTQPQAPPSSARQMRAAAGAAPAQLASRTSATATKTKRQGVAEPPADRPLPRGAPPPAPTRLASARHHTHERPGTGECTRRANGLLFCSDA